MVKVRLQGLPAEVAKVAHLLRSQVRVLQESDDYPDKRGNSQYVRRYLDIDGGPSAEQVAERPPRRGGKRL